jgi:hypothetical protein
MGCPVGVDPLTHAPVLSHCLVDPFRQWCPPVRESFLAGPRTPPVSPSASLTSCPHSCRGCTHVAHFPATSARPRPPIELAPRSPTPPCSFAPSSEHSRSLSGPVRAPRKFCRSLWFRACSLVAIEPPPCPLPW